MYHTAYLLHSQNTLPTQDNTTRSDIYINNRFTMRLSFYYISRSLEIADSNRWTARKTPTPTPAPDPQTPSLAGSNQVGFSRSLCLLSVRICGLIE